MLLSIYMTTIIYNLDEETTVVNEVLNNNTT